MHFENAGTLLMKLDGQIAFASTCFCDLVGFEHDKVAGTSYFYFVFPEDMDAARRVFETNVLPHDPLRLRLRRLDGTEMWTDIQAAPVQTAKGDVYAITATITTANDSR